MGSGKSSVARQLARLSGLPILDLDVAIEARIGTTIAHYFVTEGEESFRMLETEILAESLQSAAILATGGGIVKRDENRAVLGEAAAKGVSVVYLRANPRTLAARIRRQPGSRPLIDGDGILSLEETVERVKELLAERAHLYNECASHVIDTDERSTAQVAAEIIRLTTKAV